MRSVIFLLLLLLILLLILLLLLLLLLHDLNLFFESVFYFRVISVDRNLNLMYNV